MDCPQSRDLISLRIDGRTTTTEDRLLDAHVAGCSECAEHERRAWTLHRSLRLRPAAPMPDLTEEILARARPPRRQRLTWLRLALGWIGVLGIVQALPDLVLGHDVGEPVHLARHIGALTIALFVGFLYAAWRPHRAFGLLPIAVALAAAMSLGAIVDIIAGNVGAFAELSAHLIDLAGVAFLWLLAGSPRPRRTTSRLVTPA
jgi:predicted anti-sigma-YlaC factor YlaD